MPRSIGPILRGQWQRFSRLPGGSWLFSRLLGIAVPYSGTLGARIITLEPGHCVVSLRERRHVRNHLRSVHAMALANLGELATGLALLNGLPPGARGILTAFEIEYQKKSRGTLLAECHCEIIDHLDSPSAATSHRISAQIRDTAGDTTATVHATWLIGPEKSHHGN